NEFPDLRADKAAGKRTIVVRLGKARAAKGFVVLMFAVFFSLVAGVALQLESWYAMTGLATLPIGVFAARHALVHYDNTIVLVPANAATVITHLLTGLFMTTGYLLLGFGVGIEFVAVAAGLFLAMSLFQTRKLGMPPPA
ncbi:MAG: prenyltransferase, partial [Candidatus Thorarchaeota archaeon]